MITNSLLCQFEFRCADCQHYTGLSDFDKCCSKPPYADRGLGFLCYKTTPACRNFEPSTQTK